MKKRMGALFCAMALLLSVAVLPASAASSGKTTTYVATNIPSTFPVVKQDPGSTVVDFWHAMTANNGVLVNNIVNWYNSTEGKKQKIFVKPIFQGGYDAITIKIQSTLQSGSYKNLPDLVQLSSVGAFSVKESSKIIYMQDLMDKDTSFAIKSKLNKNSMWGCSYKGKQLGMPFSNSMIAMHYNADAFRAVGIDPANPPKTFAELATDVSKLVIKGKGKKPSRYGIACKISAYQFSTWVPREKSGAFVLDKEEGRQGIPTSLPCVADGTLKTLLSEWKKVVDTGGVDTAPPSMATSIASGNSTIILASQTQYDVIDAYFAGLKNKSQTFEHMMYRIPSVNADDSIGTSIGGAALYMFEKGNDTKKAATWKFVKFLCSVDVSAYFYVKSNYFPLNNDAINTKYVQDYLKATPNKKVCLDILTESASAYKSQEAWMPSYGMFDSMTGDQCYMYVTNKQTLEKTIDNIVKRTELMFKLYKNANS